MRLWESTTTKGSATSIVPESVDVEKMNTRTEYDIEIEESRGRPLTVRPMNMSCYPKYQLRLLYNRLWAPVPVIKISEETNNSTTFVTLNFRQRLTL